MCLLCCTYTYLCEEGAFQGIALGMVLGFSFCVGESLRREPRMTHETPWMYELRRIAYGYHAKPRCRTPARDTRGIFSSSEQQRQVAAGSGNGQQRAGSEQHAANLRQQQATASSKPAAAVARSERAANEQAAHLHTHPPPGDECGQCRLRAINVSVLVTVHSDPPPKTPP
jgi:hypothetical protein